MGAINCAPTFMSRYKRLPYSNKLKKDEFISFFDKFLGWIHAQRKLLIPIFIIGVVGSIFFLVMSKSGEDKVLQVNNALFEALQSENKKDSLIFLVTQNKNKQSLFMATLELMQMEALEGKTTEALKWLTQAKSQIPSFLKPMLVLSEVQLLWEEGKQDKALDLLKPWDNKEDLILGKYPLFLKAKILDDLGQTEEALALYRKIYQEEEVSSFFLRQEAKARALWILVNQEEKSNH